MVTSSNEKYTVGSIYQVCMCLALMNELYTEVSHQKKSRCIEQEPTLYSQGIL